MYIRYRGVIVKKRVIIIVCSSIATVVLLAIVIPLMILGIRTANLTSDYSYLKNDENYSEKVEVQGLNLVTQHVSCGYASIEMVSEYYGNKVTEDDLDSRNSSVSTSSSSGFLNEINKSILSKKFVMKSYLKHDDMLKEIYGSLKKGNPVVLEWSAKYKEEWTLHFSVITSLDIKNDTVTVYNPYGYIENLKLDEFLDRSSFNAYKNIPFFLSFGFAFGMFGKNTIFYAE